MERVGFKEQCPHYIDTERCEGELIYLGEEITCLGTINGVDRNSHRQRYTCPRCERFFHRVWTWEESKGKRQ